MGNIGSLVVKAFIKYVAAHPEVLESLLEKLIDEVIKHLDGNPTT